MEQIKKDLFNEAKTYDKWVSGCVEDNVLHMQTTPNGRIYYLDADLTTGDIKVYYTYFTPKRLTYKKKDIGVFKTLKEVYATIGNIDCTNPPHINY